MLKHCANKAISQTNSSEMATNKSTNSERKTQSQIVQDSVRKSQPDLNRCDVFSSRKTQMQTVHSTLVSSSFQTVSTSPDSSGSKFVTNNNNNNSNNNNNNNNNNSNNNNSKSNNNNNTSNNNHFDNN